MSPQRIRLANSPIGLVPLNWKYSSATMESYLSGIAGYGFEGIQISADQGQSADFLQLMVEKRLRRAEQYVAIRCNLEGPLEGAEAETKATVEMAKNAGVEMLVFAVDGSDDRERFAGRADKAEHLSENGFKRLGEHIEKYAALAHSYGIKSSFHQHAATYIETTDETRTLMNLMDRNLVGVCLDVGHWIVGGGDPIAAVSEYSDRITHVHVKDVNGEILAKMIAGEYKTMHDAVHDDKLFVPAGQGILKLRELFIALESIGYKAWLMSEQDSAYEPSEDASGISMENIKVALN